MTVIMLAPNGGRRMPSDHPAIPVTMDQTIACAVAGRDAGADAIHVHLRDGDGGHLLDSGAYRALIDGIADAAPDISVQITTEAIGCYDASQQMQIVREARPDFASCALRELADAPGATAFYHDMHAAGIGIQHILYDPAEVAHLTSLVRSGAIPARGLSVIFVVGSYPDGGGAHPDKLADFVSAIRPLAPQWMACGFGANETRVLGAAMAMGGHARVGFENSLQMADGRIARDNSDRVTEIAILRQSLGLSPGDVGMVLGRP